MTTTHEDERPPGPFADDEVPRRLRAARTKRGLTVRELARRVGVSPSAISQIENSRAKPSVSLLYGIVTELGVSLDALLMNGNGFEGDDQKMAANGCIVERSDDRSLIELESGVLWERLAGSDQAGVDFLYVTYPPGSSSSPQSLIRHNGHEYGILLDGELEVTAGFQTVTLATGDSISFDSTIPHRLTNHGDRSATAVWIVIGRNDDVSRPSSSLT